MIKGKIKNILIAAGLIALVVVAVILLFGDKLFNMKPHSSDSADLDPLAKGVIVLNVPDEPYDYSGGTFDPLDGVTAFDSDGTDLTNAVTVSVNENSSYTEKELVYSVTGKGLRSATATRPLHLSNYSGPTITIISETIECDISQISTLSDMIYNNEFVTADDGFGKDISHTITVSNRSDINQSGTYNITVTAENFLHDKATANVKVEVFGETHENPIILATDSVMIDAGDSFDPSAYIVSAFDPDYGDLTDYIKYTTNLNPYIAGEYYMNFFISNFDGVTTAPVTLYITVVGEIPGE